MRDRNRPAAILLDFGGVLVDVHYRPDGLAEVAAEVERLLRRSSGSKLAAARIEADLQAGWRAYHDWKDSEARRPRPREIGHREFWADLVAADWPPAARSAVAAHAWPLCQLLDVATKDRPPKIGALELLQKLQDLGIRTGCVSNSLGAAGSRALMREYGFEELLGIQVYSDEVGIRKPNPEIFLLAATSLDVEPGDCWYVGDTRDRDVVGGRRAGLGRVILMISTESGTGAYASIEPDVIVERPADLLALLGAEASA